MSSTDNQRTTNNQRPHLEFQGRLAGLQRKKKKMMMMMMRRRRNMCALIADSTDCVIDGQPTDYQQPTTAPRIPKPASWHPEEEEEEDDDDDDGDDEKKKHVRSHR